MEGIYNGGSLSTHRQQQRQHYGTVTMRRKSTNPFDDSSSDEDSETSQLFYDCFDDEDSQQQYETYQQTDHEASEHQSLLSPSSATKRLAPLNFDLENNTEENPALTFDQQNTNADRSRYFISPLESALLAWRSPTNPQPLVDHRLESPTNHDTNNEEEEQQLGDDSNNSNDTDNGSIGSESRWSRLVRIASSASSLFLQGIDPDDDDDDEEEEQDENTTHSRSSGENYLGITTDEEESLGLERTVKLNRSTSYGSRRTVKSYDTDDNTDLGEARDDFEVFTPPNNRNMHNGDSSTASNNHFSSRHQRSSVHKRQRRKSNTTINPAPPEKNPILHKLHTFPKDSEFTMDYRSPGTPWTHLIILEDLGTASSWAILLLPYIAFLICLILDAESSLRIETVGPFNATSPCVGSRSGSTGYDVPMNPTPHVSCSYPFTLSNRQGLLSYGDQSYALVRSHYKALMPTGTAFASGPIANVPPSSDFLYGDAEFKNLPTEIVAMVAQGQVVSSTVVLQRAYGSVDEWSPVKITKPARLSMKCTPNSHGTESFLAQSHSLTELTWNCSSPRIMDVVCAEPGTAIFTGTEIKINVLYSHVHGMNAAYESLEYFTNVDDIYREEFSYVFAEPVDLQSALLQMNLTSDPHTLISEMVQSSRYLIEHERPSYETIEISVRLSMLILSLVFIVGWCWSLGLKGFFGRDIAGNWFWFPCRFSWRKNPSEELPLTLQKKKMLPWWESPWLLLPERRYLLVLLLCLLLLQNPLLAYAYFHPWMYSKASFHSAADALMGIGVHGILMLWLCLFQGLRYHSASISRKRAKQQRQALELRRAAKYIAQGDHTQYGTGTEDSISRYTASYYEQYGDVDGSGSSGDLHLRLKHDPCGDSWADFLLPKLFLFACGAASVILAAIYRFPASDNMATLSPRLLYRYSTTYVVSSFVQLIILVLWVVLITRNAFMTGAKLRKEPFLSTRPAQLAYRVLLCVLLLGIAALALPFFVDLYHLMKPGNVGRNAYGVEEEMHPRGHSPLEISLQVLYLVSERFPYSGTAASIGPGKILFATVCALVAAFIFLPSRSFFEDELDATEQRKKMIGGDEWTGALAERVRQRRDKRLVVTLARYTHTWRVFPLPIKKNSILASELLSGGAFHLNQNLQIDYGTANSRGVGYLNRYMPVFCVETACWLLEASWQSYYSPMEFSTNEFAPGRMSLENIGLRLESAIYDESTHTQAIVATNIDKQVDGEEDSIIVIAFRGTMNATNLRTDLKMRQVSLPETFLGDDDQTTFRVHTDHIDASGYDGWNAWIGLDDKSPQASSPASVGSKKEPKIGKNRPSVHAFSPRPSPTDTITWKQEKPSGFSAVSSGAKAAIRANPLMRHKVPRVHEGFLHSYNKIRKELWLAILPVLQRQLSKSVMLAMTTPRCSSYQGNHAADGGKDNTERPLALPKIYITGHSLGGSLGQLLALDLSSNCELVIQNAQRATTTEDEVFTLAGFEEPSLAPPPPIPPPHRVDGGRREESSDTIFQDSTDVPINENYSSPFQNVRKHFFTDEVWNDGLMGSRHQHDDDHDNAPNKLYLQPPIALYSYGQPRVGNRAFAKLYKQRVPHTFRVVNEGDITTSLPNLAMSGGFYKHAGLEVMLDEGCTGNILVGPTIVETLFRFSKVRTSVTAHALERYRECLESSLGPDELLEYYNAHGLDGTHSHSRSSIDPGCGNGITGVIPMSAAKAKLPDWVTQIRRSDAGN